MSRDTLKKPQPQAPRYRNKRASAKSDSWFRPSREDVAIYNALAASSRPLSVKEISDAGCARPSTVDHTLRYWCEIGITKRTFLDKKAWYRWSPSVKGRKAAQALKDSASLVSELPREAISSPKAMPAELDLHQILRVLSRLFSELAEKYREK